MTKYLLTKSTIIIFLINVFGSHLMREHNYSLLLTYRIVTVNFFTITLNDRCLTIPSWVNNPCPLGSRWERHLLYKIVVRLSADKCHRAKLRVTRVFPVLV